MVVFTGATEDCEELVLSTNPPSFAPLLGIRNTIDPLEDAHVLVGFGSTLDSVKVRFPHDTLRVRLREDHRVFDVEIPQFGASTGDIWIQAFGVKGDALSRKISPAGNPYYEWTFEFQFSANTKTTGNQLENALVTICEDDIEKALQTDNIEWESVPPQRVQAGDDVWQPPMGLEGE